jgi:hypothetical protein
MSILVFLSNTNLENSESTPSRSGDGAWRAPRGNFDPMVALA